MFQQSRYLEIFVNALDLLIEVVPEIRNRR